ncbi:MAG: C4-dicarboxylate ABC transporter substrate-binding protein [Geminicoccaceae bacterium]|nr:MAG: C4-dicarboxylate ABC transporter substrate-binding protein [Geminicoccaceae bacterium]
MTKRAVAFGVALALSALGSAASAQSWNMATPYPDTNFHTQNIKMFIEEIEAATPLRITLHTNASLLRMPEIMRGVQTRQAQLGEILLSAYGNDDPMFRVDSIPFLAPGFVNGIKLWHASREAIEQRFEDRGLIVLYSVPWPGQGIYTKEPMATPDALNGVSFRAYNAATARLAELMGAIPTTVQAAEIPQAFATGIVSAMITSAATGVDSQAWDFVQYYYNTRAMNTRNVVFVNAQAFNGLDAETQQVIREAAARAEIRGWMMSAEAEELTTSRLAEEGMTVANASPEVMEALIAIGTQMAEEWVAEAGDEGRALLEAIGR